jgi:DNA helicase-2/ATP-dependent DNA helicase PcrA
VEGLDAPVRHNITLFHETIEEYGKKIFKAPSLVPVVRQLIAEIGYEEELLRDAGLDAGKYQKSLQFVQGVVNSIAVFEHDETVEKRDLFSYLEKVALLTSEDNEEQEKKPNAVTLLTMHSCKGLESPMFSSPPWRRGASRTRKASRRGKKRSRRNGASSMSG